VVFNNGDRMTRLLTLLKSKIHMYPPDTKGDYISKCYIKKKQVNMELYYKLPIEDIVLPSSQLV